MTPAASRSNQQERPMPSETIEALEARERELAACMDTGSPPMPTDQPPAVTEAHRREAASPVLMGVVWSEEDQGYIATMPILPGCSAFGSTIDEALSELRGAILSWIDAKIAAAERRGAPQWQPIESAPRDGTTFLGWSASNGVTETWFAGPHEWWDVWSGDRYSPTHWMPLPPLSEPPR